MERSSQGPTVVEARTSHVAGYALCETRVPFPFSAEDVATRASEAVADGNVEGEAQEAEKGGLDPVRKFEDFCIDHALLQPVERGLIADRIEQLVEAVLEEAETSALPPVETADSGVFN